MNEIGPDVYLRELERLENEPPPAKVAGQHFLAGTEVWVVLTDTTHERNEIKRVKVQIPEYHRVGEPLKVEVVL